MNRETILLTLPESWEGLHTSYIQDALDSCRYQGGEVVLGDGEWHIGSIRLFSNTTLRLSAGTVLIASDKMEDYENFHVPSTLGYLKRPWVIEAWHLPEHYILAPIVAFDAENVAVIGEPGAVIDGSDCFDPEGEEKFRGPMGMVFSKCRNVTLRGYTYRNSANWAHQLDSCTNVRMENVTVLAGHDGVNIHHCVGVLIENCDFRTGDDCVAGYNADRISGRHNTLCAFEYYAMCYDDIRVDSENWVIRNCVMENVDSLIDYRFGNDFTHDARPLRDISFENVTMTGMLRPAVLNPIPGHPLCCTLKNVSISWREGAAPERACHTGADVKLVLDNAKIQGFNA